MRKYGLQSLPFDKNPSEWTAEESRLFDIQMEQFQKDCVFLDRLSNNPRYFGKWVYVYEEKVIAAGKNPDKLRRKVVKMGGPELPGRAAHDFISPTRRRLILKSVA